MNTNEGGFMDGSDVIARREFMPTYIWLDVAFLIGFAALLVWRRKYMTLLVGLVMGGVYFAVGYGAFNLLTHSRSISGGSMSKASVAGPPRQWFMPGTRKVRAKLCVAATPPLLAARRS